MFIEYKNYWKNAFNFKGKATRKEFWFVVLTNFLIYVVLLFASKYSIIFYNIFLLYFIFQIIPNLSIQIRRIRDVGKKWYLIFINLIPIIGAIFWIYQLILPSAK